jgi:hypothetical protein
MATPAIGPYSTGPIELDTETQRAAAGAAAPTGMAGALLNNIWALLSLGTYGLGNNTSNANLLTQATLLRDAMARSAQLNAPQLYRDRYTAPGASQPVDMPHDVPGDHSVINQGATSYRGQPLGNGSSTISGSGCALAAVTMASNDLTGSNHNLLDSNARLVNAGNFARSSSDLDIAGGARTLGLTAVSDRKLGTDANLTAAAHQMDRSDRPLRMVAGVDYKGGGNDGRQRDGETDHFLTIERHDQATGRLVAKDPAGGHRIEFERSGDRWVEVRNPALPTYHAYQITTFQMFAATNQPAAVAANNRVMIPPKA